MLVVKHTKYIWISALLLHHLTVQMSWIDTAWNSFLFMLWTVLYWRRVCQCSAILTAICFIGNVYLFFQGVDASLIPTISFPAFATHEEVLCVETKANVVHRLKGRYGFKRFCRDGYKCVLEDSNRRHYRNGETKVTRMNCCMGLV